MFGVYIMCVMLVQKYMLASGQCVGSRCGECIVSGLNCRWCKQNAFNGTRCGEENKLLADGCPSNDIVQHPTSTLTPVKDEALQDGDQGTPVQLKPQEITVKLVPNKPFKTTYKYRVARNFPVDIYFLVDPSFTMRTLKDQLAALANDIATSIGGLTNDYRFGYGTSMDKVAIPFTHTSKYYLENPCLGQSNTYCDPPHSFLHRLSLTSNVTAFKEAVSTTRLTANNDKTEGLLDGMMQVIVCTQEIGWRRQARRILIYASDTDFHFAGDGKLAGIVKPHDLKCHLERQGDYLKYTHDTILDYPSVGQIRKVLADKNINSIFVINDITGAFKYFDTLKIPGSYTEILNEDAQNILNIISETYKTLRGTVNFVNDPLNNIETEFRSTCKGQHPLDTRTKCENINVGDEIDFEFWMTLKITKCPENPKDRLVKTVIRPEGLEDNIVVNVEYVCDCGCQESGSAVENATECSSHGRFECGVCHCNDGFTGSTCDCDVSKTIEETCGQIIGSNEGPLNNDSVVDRNDGQAIICSNVGKCECGSCQCPRQYSGKYCECDNGACGGYISTGQLCNGHGVCKCGVCDCDQGYNGTTCDCPTTVQTCRDPENNSSLCSEHGECICGKCVCDTNYRGKHCQECPTCKGCEDNRDCVSCVGFDKGLPGCKTNCLHVQKVDEIQVGGNVTQCQFRDSDGCLIEFTYIDKGGLNLQIEVKNTRSCPAGSPSAIILGSGVAGSVVAIGILSLIIWKIITTLMDRQEYKKFRAEVEEVEFRKSQINPGFVSPIQNFDNPTFSSEKSKEQNNGDPLKET